MAKCLHCNDNRMVCNGCKKHECKCKVHHEVIECPECKKEFRK